MTESARRPSLGRSKIGRCWKFKDGDLITGIGSRDLETEFPTQSRYFLRPTFKPIWSAGKENFRRRRVRFWHEAAEEGEERLVRCARVIRTSTGSAMAKTSSSSMQLASDHMSGPSMSDVLKDDAASEC
jgi:hypothetical protein